MASGARPPMRPGVQPGMQPEVRPGAPAVATESADAVLRRLRWRARRGMLENDLLLERFLDRHAASLPPAAIEALARLLELPDGDLLDLLLGRTEPQGSLAGAAVWDVLGRMRAG